MTLVRGHYLTKLYVKNVKNFDFGNFLHGWTATKTIECSTVLKDTKVLQKKL